MTRACVKKCYFSLNNMALQIHMMQRLATRVSRIALSSVGSFRCSASCSLFLSKQCFTSSSLPMNFQKLNRHAIPGDILKWGSLGLCRNSSFATGFTPLKAKPLGSIIDIERGENQSPEDLAAIWDDVNFLTFSIIHIMIEQLYFSM